MGVVTLNLVSKVWYDRLPADLKEAVMDASAKVEPGAQVGCRPLVQDTNTWKEKGGKIVKLSPAEQQEARQRLSAAIVPVLDKSAPLKEFYSKIKAGAATVQ